MIFGFSARIGPVIAVYEMAGKKGNSRGPFAIAGRMEGAEEVG
jgi:hypothetical protein